MLESVLEAGRREVMLLVTVSEVLYSGSWDCGDAAGEGERRIVEGIMG